MQKECFYSILQYSSIIILHFENNSITIRISFLHHGRQQSNWSYRVTNTWINVLQVSPVVCSKCHHFPWFRKWSHQTHAATLSILITCSKFYEQKLLIFKLLVNFLQVNNLKNRNLSYVVYRLYNSVSASFS